MVAVSEFFASSDAGLVCEKLQSSLNALCPCVGPHVLSTGQSLGAMLAGMFDDYDEDMVLKTKCRVSLCGYCRTRLGAKDERAMVAEYAVDYSQLVAGLTGCRVVCGKCLAVRDFTALWEKVLGGGVCDVSDDMEGMLTLEAAKAHFFVTNGYDGIDEAVFDKVMNLALGLYIHHRLFY